MNIVFFRIIYRTSSLSFASLCKVDMPLHLDVVAFRHQLEHFLLLVLAGTLIQRHVVVGRLGQAEVPHFLGNIGEVLIVGGLTVADVEGAILFVELLLVVVTAHAHVARLAGQLLLLGFTAQARLAGAQQ